MVAAEAVAIPTPGAAIVPTTPIDTLTTTTAAATMEEAARRISVAAAVLVQGQTARVLWLKGPVSVLSTFTTRAVVLIAFPGVARLPTFFVAMAPTSAQDVKSPASRAGLDVGPGVRSAAARSVL